MDLLPLNDIFDIKYGNQFDFAKMSIVDDGISFISRSRMNFGIVGKVEPVLGINPYPAGLITVTLGGTYLLSSFIQPFPFYTAQNIKVLIPKSEISINQKLFYCICIQANRFRYSSHGREANSTLNTLLVPSEMPKEFEELKLSTFQKDFSKALIEEKLTLESRSWQYFRLDELFHIKKGQRILNRDMVLGNTPCVRATSLNNGITAFIDHEPNHQGNTITVSYNGSIGEAFYQEHPFFALDDVNVLHPIDFNLNKYIGFFICSLIRKEKFRFNYGRKWHLERMNETRIKLPVDVDGNPDYTFMENYIKNLPYSASV